MDNLFLKRTCCILSFSFLVAANATAQKDTLSFLHITDLHVIFNRDIYRKDLAESRKHYGEGETSLRKFLSTAPDGTNADMVIATGDLVDFFEAETDSGVSLDIQAEQFSDLVADYPVPCFLTLGNHDLFTFVWRNNKLQHHQNSSGRARALWIRNLSCFKNGTYYSHLFQLGHTTYRLIFLDNSFYKFRQDDSTEVPYIDKAQLYWLNAQLNEADDDVEIILMHIPFKDKPAQPGAVNELYTVLSKIPSIKLILAGHRHKNEITAFPLAGDQKILQVQTGAFARDENNWRQIRLTENQIQVSYPGKTENELVIPVQ